MIKLLISSLFLTLVAAQSPRRILIGALPGIGGATSPIVAGSGLGGLDSLSGLGSDISGAAGGLGRAGYGGFGSNYGGVYNGAGYGGLGAGGYPPTAGYGAGLGAYPGLQTAGYGGLSPYGAAPAAAYGGYGYSATPVAGYGYGAAPVAAAAYGAGATPAVRRHALNQAARAAGHVVHVPVPIVIGGNSAPAASPTTVHVENNYAQEPLITQETMTDSENSAPKEEIIEEIIEQPVAYPTEQIPETPDLVVDPTQQQPVIPASFLSRAAVPVAPGVGTSGSGYRVIPSSRAGGGASHLRSSGSAASSPAAQYTPGSGAAAIVQAAHASNALNAQQRYAAPMSTMAGGITHGAAALPGATFEGVTRSDSSALALSPEGIVHLKAPAVAAATNIPVQDKTTYANVYGQR